MVKMMQALTNDRLTRWRESLDAMLRAYSKAQIEIV